MGVLFTFWFIFRGDAVPNSTQISSGLERFFYLVGHTKNLVGFSSYCFCFNSLPHEIKSNLWCSRVTRLLPVFTKTPSDKHKQNQNRQDDEISSSAGPWLRSVSVAGCDTPSEPVWAGLLVNPLGIFSAVLGDETKSPWGNSILWLILWLKGSLSAR